MTNNLICAIEDCILNLSDDNLIDVEKYGGRFYLYFRNREISVGFSVGPHGVNFSNINIAHLISIPWNSNDSLEFDEKTKQVISNSPEYIRQNLMEWTDKIFEEFIKNEECFDIAYQD
jgi:hypothetical protein